MKKLEKAVSGVLCLGCGKILVSWSVHNYKTCACPNETMVDGGRSYLRCGGKNMNLVQVVNVSPVVKEVVNEDS